jgi:small subunit ribosomal protein S4e
MLKICKNRKEVKRVVYGENILINKKIIKEDRHPVMLYDSVTIIPEKKNYRLNLKENGKFKIEEISEKDSEKKFVKIIGKKILKGKKVQLNLIDGRNFLTNVKCSIGDSCVINFKENKIEKCLALKEKANILVFAGKHAGAKGIIENLDLEKKIAKVQNESGVIYVLIKQLMVVE